MENPVREMTLQEEIEALDIEEHVKQRLLSKLKGYDYLTDKFNCELAKRQEEMFSTVRNLEQRNKALLNACESLCRAMTILGRATND